MVALNELSPGAGAKPVGKRVGRGIGSGLGKTCGKGHKGQKSRSGASISPGFEGGQMPLYRRLPKSGFNSRKKLYAAKIRLEALNKVAGDVVTLDTLKEAGLINKHIKQVKIFLAGKITRPVQVSGIAVTSGARAAIEAAGGKVEG